MTGLSILPEGESHLSRSVRRGGGGIRGRGGGDGGRPRGVDGCRPGRGGMDETGDGGRPVRGGRDVGGEADRCRSRPSEPRRNSVTCPGSGEEGRWDCIIGTWVGSREGRRVLIKLLSAGGQVPRISRNQPRQ